MTQEKLDIDTIKVRFAARVVMPISEFCFIIVNVAIILIFGLQHISWFSGAIFVLIPLASLPHKKAYGSYSNEYEFLYLKSFFDRLLWVYLFIYLLIAALGTSLYMFIGVDAWFYILLAFVVNTVYMIFYFMLRTGRYNI